MIRTLVVDDDYRVADLHCAYVERVSGFVVAGRAHTGAEALSSVDQLRPDLVLLDIYLPDISGLEVLQQLREDDHPPVDVISITAAREVESLRAAMRGGVVHYLIKPFLFAIFEEKLLSYAAARDRMKRIGHAEQTDVDRIFAALQRQSIDFNLAYIDSDFQVAHPRVDPAGQRVAPAPTRRRRGRPRGPRSGGGGTDVDVAQGVGCARARIQGKPVEAGAAPQL